VGQGITSAARWLAANVPVFSINCVLITESDLWALRYPDTHELHVLERDAGGPTGSRHLEHASARGTIRVRSGHLASRPAVVVATERMDEDPGWREMESGELLHVNGSLKVTRERVLTDPPAHELTLADLDPHTAASQKPVGS
jgi:glutamine amidotransferase